MDLSKSLGMKGGRWLAANCGNMPSENNCKLVMMAPENQREDLLDAAVAHAVKSHKHQATKELRQELDKFLSTVVL